MSNATQSLAKQLKAIADPLRLSIVRVTAVRAFGVVELAEIFDVGQPSMSHHLKKLASEGWLVTRREGNSIYYRRSTDINPFKAALFTQIDELPLDDSVTRQLDAANTKRQERSQAFFEQSGHAVSQQTELVASFTDYDDIVAAMLPAGESVIEIGPGQGEFLTVLAERYKDIVAVDLSSAMVEACLNRAANHGIKARIKEGGADIKLPQSGHFDVAISNMVLHHVPDPQKFISQIASQLRKDGIWVVCDLVAHEQNWTLDACGDLWLGFDENTLEQWAQHHQFHLQRRDCIALNNGFNIFVHRYRLEDKPTT